MKNDTKLLIVLMAAAILIPFVVLYMSLEFGFYDSRMLLVMIMMFTTLPMIAGGVYMWATGKGQMAISGYNTMSKASRELYDGEKMAKDVGKFLVVLSVTMLGICLFSYLPQGMLVFWIVMGLIFGEIVIFMVYAGSGKRYLKDPTKTPPPPTKHDKQVVWALLGVSGITTGIILVIVFLVSMNAGVAATLDDDSFHVKGPSMNRYVYYEDIVTIEFRDGFDHGTRTYGFAGTSVLGGNFHNSEFGDYSLACYKDVRQHIVITPAHGKVLVFNLSTAEETEEFCLELINRVFEPPAMEL